jgi:hypothetical protein
MKKITGKKGSLLESTLGKWIFALLLLVILLAIIVLAKGKMTDLVAKLRDSIRFR